METRIFSAVLNKEEGAFVSTCPEIGTVSQGDSVEEALANLKEATELYLEEFPVTEEAKPIVTFFEVPKYAKTKENIRA